MMPCRVSLREVSSSMREAAINSGYSTLVKSGSGNSRKNDFRTLVTELTSWKKSSGRLKSTCEESNHYVSFLPYH